MAATLAAPPLTSRTMLAAGDRLPDLTLFGVDAEPVALHSLTPVMIAFYLYDWTGT